MKLYGKAVSLHELQGVFQAAGIVVQGLTRSADELYTFDATGGPAELPAACRAVLDAYTMAPPPASPLQVLTLAVSSLTTRVTALEVARGA